MLWLHCAYTNNQGEDEGEIEPREESRRGKSRDWKSSSSPVREEAGGGGAGGERRGNGGHGRHWRRRSGTEGRVTRRGKGMRLGIGRPDAVPVQSL